MVKRPALSAGQNDEPGTFIHHSGGILILVEVKNNEH